jgi:hypothetical protein
MAPAVPHNAPRIFHRARLSRRVRVFNFHSKRRGTFLSGKVVYAVTVSGDLATVALFAGVKP